MKTLNFMILTLFMTRKLIPLLFNFLRQFRFLVTIGNNLCTNFHIKLKNINILLKFIPALLNSNLLELIKQYHSKKTLHLIGII